MLATAFVACEKDEDNNNNGGNNDDNVNTIVVDLGLPSGIKWAKMNLGANNPWENGDYYAWGETQTKSNYEWSTYKYCKGSLNNLTKYCNKASYGNDHFTDELISLQAIDDAATAVLGTDYRIPTFADWNELNGQCYWVWTSNYNNQNVSGYIVYKAKSNNDKGVKVYNEGTPSSSYSLSDTHIFLPAAGGFDTSSFNVGYVGYYWSASLYEEFPCNARYCNFVSRDVDISYYGDRFYGFSIRPVSQQ